MFAVIPSPKSVQTNKTKQNSKAKQRELSTFTDMSYHIITCIYLISEIKDDARFWINIVT